jgi:hypothetical protein
MVQIWSWNRNRNFSKVGTGTLKNSYGSTTLYAPMINTAPCKKIIIRQLMFRIHEILVWIHASD